MYTQNTIEKFHWDPRIKQFRNLVGDCYRANGLIHEAWYLAQHYWRSKSGPGLVPLDEFMAIPHAQQILDCKLAIVEHEGFADILEDKIWAALEAKSKGLSAAKINYGITLFTSKRTKNEAYVYVKGSVDQMLWFTLNGVTGKIGGIRSAEARRNKYGTARPITKSAADCVGIATIYEGGGKGPARGVVGSANSLYKNTSKKDSSCINPSPFSSSPSLSSVLEEKEEKKVTPETGVTVFCEPQYYVEQNVELKPEPKPEPKPERKSVEVQKLGEQLAREKKAKLGKDTSIAVARYCEGWKQAHKINPEIERCEVGILRLSVSEKGLEKTLSLIDAFFEIPDSYLHHLMHPLRMFSLRSKQLAHFAETGHYEPNTIASQAVRTNMHQIERYKARSRARTVGGEL